MNTSGTFPTDQRGAALPMAMLVLLVLSTLVIGLSAISASEPSIANNHLTTSQARFLAEAGLERALWALQNPRAHGGLANPLPRPVPVPFDGNSLIPVSAEGSSIGGFRVGVTTGDPGCRTAAERCVTAVGWAPSDTTNLRTAHRKVTATARNPQLLFKEPPAALSVRGDLQLAGNVSIDARADSTCGGKAGSVSTGTTHVQGQVDVRGGADGNNVPNETTDAHHGAFPANAHDIVGNLATGAFDQFGWSDADVDFLRAYARAHGTYLRGSVRFDASNPLPNGLVFVDTITGTNIAAATPSSDFADVSIQGNAPADPAGVFRGWIFVNGSLSIDGTFPMRGLVYAQDDVSYHAVGAAKIDGAVIGRNIRGGSSTSISSAAGAGVVVSYNCREARTGGDTIPDRWTITPGTYKELCDSCG